MKFERRGNIWYASYLGQGYVGNSIPDIINCINQRNNINPEV